MFCWCRSYDVFIFLIYNEDFNTIKILLNKAKWINSKVHIQQEIKSFQANKAHKSGDTIHQERYHLYFTIFILCNRTTDSLQHQNRAKFFMTSWTSLWMPRVNQLRWQSMINLYIFLHCDSFSFHKIEPLEVNIHP